MENCSDYTGFRGELPVGFDGGAATSGTLESTALAGTQRFTRTWRTIRVNGRQSLRRLTQGGVVAMKRLFVCSVLAAMVVAGRGVAQEPAPLAGNDYYADAMTPIDGNCPDGTAG